MKNAIIVGATGFGGIGLIHILNSHPELKVKQVTALDHGKKISDIHPHLKGICDLPVEHPDEVIYEDTDIVFLATPDRVGMNIVSEFYKRNIPVIDFSGDFRFNSQDDYTVYAANKGMETIHSCPEILTQAVYGLPEKNYSLIEKANIIGNPGCFAISMILGLLPAAESGLLLSDTIVCDGKTGVSGAGINPGQANSYPLRYDNTNAYREGTHQHLVEVENILNRFKEKNSGEKQIFFVPQIIPQNRGILTTMYSDCSENIKTDDILEIYRKFYADSPFVIVSDKSPSTSEVRGTNRCVVRPMIDKRTGKLFVTSVIDNLMKGQSGNAVQNANIRLGLGQNTGLDMPAFYP